MIAIAHWRRGGPYGREPLVAPHGNGGIASQYTASQQFWGKVTSKRPPAASRADLELIAFRLGCSVDAARRAMELGLLK